ncbi:MAG: hemolysin [Actinobacteria bacterium HGW-Actinobacteria-2]|nr:MAG: hemolysin [Actinobacteria bacterium HGW-Actinobacteria-2]
MTQVRSDADIAEAKPRLRGWLHLGATPLAIIGGVLLIALSPTIAGKIGAAIWLAGAVLLFGTSATYHLGNWGPTARDVLRRWDHSNIFAFIAATYTPIAIALLPDPTVMLVLIWSIAVAGMAVQIAWPTAPRWLNVACYLGMGWAGVGWLPAFWTLGGPAVVILILLGGVAYSLGAVVYARKWPNPSPTWFGFHEIFHAFTVIAAGCHFAAITVAIFA